MSRIEVTFATPTHVGFSWLDSFERLEEEEIEKFIVILRGALAAFRAELANRREESSDQRLEHYKILLQETAKNINEQELTPTHERYLNSLKAQAQGKKSKAARQYTWLISTIIGWPYVLLIYCALGKHKVELLNEYQQVHLVKYMAKHRNTLFCCRLNDRAIQCQFQEKCIKVDLPLTRSSQKRKRPNTDGALNIKTRDQQSVSLAGIMTVERATSSTSNTRAGALPGAGILPISTDTGSGGTIANNGHIEPAIDTERPEPLANSFRFNQQVVQPVVATTSGANTVVSGLDTEEVDSVSTLTPDITAQHARHSRPAETAGNNIVLPILSELGAAYTGDDVDTATTFRREETVDKSGNFESEYGSHSSARDTGLSSFQSDSFSSTPSTAESQQSLTLNRINYEVVEQPVASAQDLNQSYNLQPGTNQSEQGMSSRLLMRERQHVPCFISTASAALFADNEFLSIPSCNDVQGFFSDRSRVMHSPSPPQVLLVAEKLYRNIRVYFKDSCQNMIFDNHGTLLNPNGAELQNGLCNEFDSYCFTATMLQGRKLHVEFGHVLSKASALVEQILRAEHPRTLACFLEVFIHLIQTGLPEVASMLRNFIKKMSEEVTSGGHPWGQICRLLGELDSEPLDQAMAQIWKCTTETFENELGASSRLAVSVRLDYIKRVYGFKEHPEEERLLRDLLDGIPRVSTPRVMLNLAHNLNRQGRHDEAEKMAAEVFSLLQQNEIYAKRIVEKIECKKIVAHSQFNQGKALLAEWTIREAIKMIVDQWGQQHCWVLEFENVLEGWLEIEAGRKTSTHYGKK